MISNHKDFIKTLDVNEYPLNAKDALTLLSHSAFSLKDKERIIEHIDERVILESSPLVNQVISVILLTKNAKLWTGSLDKLVTKSGDTNICVKLLTLLLKTQTISEQDIISILCAIGGKYSAIAGRKKRPELPDDSINSSLLVELKRIHFISSFSNGKNGIRVNPRKNNS